MENKITVKIYIDGVYFGIGNYMLIPSYRANGWTVVLDQIN